MPSVDCWNTRSGIRFSPRNLCRITEAGQWRGRISFEIRHAQEACCGSRFSLEGDIRPLVLPLVLLLSILFTTHLFHLSTQLPNCCCIFSLSSFCLVTSSFHILRTNKSSLSSGNPKVQSTASFQPVVEYLWSPTSPNMKLTFQC